MPRNPINAKSPMNSTNPINILYLIDSLGNGGTERQLVELIRGLDRNRFRPHLCTLKPSTALYDELDIPKITLDFVSFFHPSIFRNLLMLYRFIRKNRISIIQTFFQDSFLLAAIIKPFHKAKMIGSFRDLGFWRTPSESRKMRLAYPFFDGFIANSQAVKEHFAQTDGIARSKIAVIFNGFDMSSVPHDLALSKSADHPIVGIVANLNRTVKRVDDFIQAAALVHKKLPHARFVVVGDGHLRDGLEDLANSLGLKDVIQFTGRINNPLGVISSFSVGVITSETEGFCNAIIECMACSVPVVATDGGGNRELIINQSNGFLVPVGDCHDIADKILKLLMDENLASHLGGNGLETVRSRFTIDEMVNSYDNLYNSIRITDDKYIQ